jgi:elongation of very long chain fatty acids protein 6
MMRRQSTSTLHVHLSLTCSYPSRDADRFEKKYDPIPVLNWMRDRPIIPIVGVVAYGVLICLGQYWMKDKESLKWRTTLTVWNLFLSAFSAIGMLRTAPQLVHNLMTLSLRDNLCTDPRITYGSGSTGLWVQLFILSKFP